MTFLQLIRILWAHRWIELAALALVLALAVLLSLLLPKQYTAVASMFIDVRSPDPIAGVVLPGVASSGYISTQVDIVKSDRVARAVSSALNLEDRSFIQEKWRKETDEKIDLHAWIVEYLHKRLRVQPGRESSVINVVFTGDSAAFAAEAANAFAKAYLATVLDLKLEPARLYATWFEDQTRVVRERLESAQKALSEYQQQAGILVPDDRIDFEASTLNELTVQLTSLRAEITSSQHKRNASKANSVAEVMNSDVVKAMKIEISRLDAKLRESLATLTDDHPRVIRMQQELTAMKLQLAAEMKLIATSIETSYQIGKQRERDLLQAIADQKVRVLALNKQRDQLNVYKRDVESAQRAFEAVSQRAAQTRLESLSNQTNAGNLSAAEPPTKPSQPRVFFNLLVAACIGTMLALGLGLLLELLNRRVRSEQDLAVIGVPLLASLSSSRPIQDRGAGRIMGVRPVLAFRKAAISG